MVPLLFRRSEISFLLILLFICALALPASFQAETVYFEDFEDGPAGWTPVELSEQESVFIQNVSNEGIIWCCAKGKDLSGGEG